MYKHGARLPWGTQPALSDTSASARSGQRRAFWLDGLGSERNTISWEIDPSLRVQGEMARSPIGPGKKVAWPFQRPQMPPGCRVCPQPRAGLATPPREDHVGPATHQNRSSGHRLEQKAGPAAGPLDEGWEEIPAQEGGCAHLMAFHQSRRDG